MRMNPESRDRFHVYDNQIHKTWLAANVQATTWDGRFASPSARSKGSLSRRRTLPKVFGIAYYCIVFLLACILIPDHLVAFMVFAVAGLLGIRLIDHFTQPEMGGTDTCRPSGSSSHVHLSVNRHLIDFFDRSRGWGGSRLGGYAMEIGRTLQLHGEELERLYTAAKIVELLQSSSSQCSLQLSNYPLGARRPGERDRRRRSR